jgi:hypothetical protein
MKKLFLALFVFVPTVFLTSCVMTSARYAPGYTNDYVYSVGYYGYRPYWGSRFYTGPGYWGGYRGFWGGYRNTYFGGHPRAWYGYVSRW